MKERPILFSKEMIRAILENRKSQTRRIVKERPPYIYVDEGKVLRADEFGDYHDYSPYGKIGDKLWVRETWMNENDNYATAPAYQRFIYRASSPEYGKSFKWKSSIFMPRRASRITLEITAVKVERLQDISVADAMAEGIIHHSMNDPRVEYRWLWESINGHGSWDSSPWVWCISFKRILEVDNGE